MTVANRDILANGFGRFCFAVGATILSALLEFLTFYLHTLWLTSLSRVPGLNDCSVTSLVFWSVACGIALFIHAALGFGFVYAASLLSKYRAEGASVAFICGCIPWVISLLLFGLIFLFMPKGDAVFLTMAYVLGAPVLTLFGQFSAWRYVNQTAAPPPLKIVKLDFEKMKALDSSLIQLLEADSLIDARHKAHACMLILGVSTDPSGDEALTLLPERLITVDRAQSAMAVTDLQMRLSGDS